MFRKIFLIQLVTICFFGFSLHAQIKKPISKPVTKPISKPVTKPVSKPVSSPIEKKTEQEKSTSTSSPSSTNNDSVTITITNIGKIINSAFWDYAAVISADGQMMVFTSRRPVTEKEIKKNKESMEYVYVSYFDEKSRQKRDPSSGGNKKWSVVKRLEETINDPKRNNSAIALSNDGQTMLLYRDDEFRNGDIFESQLKGKKWTEPEKLPEPINTPYHESSASISPDGHTFYFVSNRKGGEGGRDIWQCTKDKNGQWGEAVNLGKTINTPSDEEAVFIHADGKTLYFSSKGHGGLGGYDIFKSVFEDGKWSIPVNMGSPINTDEDDLFFVIAASGQVAYYNSSKAGGFGGRDIYEIRFTPLPTAKKETGPQLTLLKGTITDEKTGQTLEANIEIIDNEKNESFSKLKSNSETGKYLQSLPSGKNYGIAVTAEGYLFHSENVNIPFSAGYQEIIRDVQLKKLEVGKSIVLNNIFYDFDKATLRNESMSELERLIQLMNENPTMKIEISSHTDSKGTDEYNQKLSQNRAQSVVNFLIGKNVSKERMVAKGYGETIPIATNDTDEGMQQNRRTEFKILAK